METVKQKMQNAVSAQPTETLKETAELLMAKQGEEAAISFVFVMNELESRMADQEFIDFCDAL